MDEFNVQKAGDLLLKFGPRSITMDDIAAQLGISKKTIYKEFANKQEIIQRVAGQNVKQFLLDVQGAREAAADAVEELLRVTEILADISGLVKTSFASEMERGFPETWRIIEKEWHAALIQSISANLDRGVAEGLYRSNFDKTFVINIRLSQILRVLNGNVIIGKTTDTRTVLRQLTEFYLQALCNEAGRRRIEQVFIADA